MTCHLDRRRWLPLQIPATCQLDNPYAHLCKPLAKLAPIQTGPLIFTTTRISQHITQANHTQITQTTWQPPIQQWLTYLPMYSLRPLAKTAYIMKRSEYYSTNGFQTDTPNQPNKKEQCSPRRNFSTGKQLGRKGKSHEPDTSQNHVHSSRSNANTTVSINS